MTSHKSVIPHEHKNFIPIEQIEEPLTQNPEQDDIVVTRKSKRQRVAKFFGMTVLCTLWMTHQRLLNRHIPLLM
jgi:hypothetical protein